MGAFVVLNWRVASLMSAFRLINGFAIVTSESRKLECRSACALHIGVAVVVAQLRAAAV